VTIFRFAAAWIIGSCAIACGAEDANVRPRAPANPPETASAVLGTGSSAPDFTARDIDGKTITLSNHLGKEVVLLDFCSTWCEPCVAEFAHLRTLYHANKDRGLIVLAISIDGPDTVAKVPSFARRNKLNFPMLLDEDSRIAFLYNPKKTAPATVLIDRSGKIAAMREGYTSGDEQALATDVARALDGSAR